MSTEETFEGYATIVAVQVALAIALEGAKPAAARKLKKAAEERSAQIIAETRGQR